VFGIYSKVCRQNRPELAFKEPLSAFFKKIVFYEPPCLFGDFREPFEKSSIIITFLVNTVLCFFFFMSFFYVFFVRFDGLPLTQVLVLFYVKTNALTDVSLTLIGLAVQWQQVISLCL